MRSIVSAVPNTAVVGGSLLYGGPASTATLDVVTRGDGDDAARTYHFLFSSTLERSDFLDAVAARGSFHTHSSSLNPAERDSLLAFTMKIDVTAELELSDELRKSTRKGETPIPSAAPAAAELIWTRDELPTARVTADIVVASVESAVRSVTPAPIPAVAEPVLEILCAGTAAVADAGLSAASAEISVDFEKAAASAARKLERARARKDAAADAVADAKAASKSARRAAKADGAGENEAAAADAAMEVLAAAMVELEGYEAALLAAEETAARALAASATCAADAAAVPIKKSGADALGSET